MEANLQELSSSSLYNQELVQRLNGPNTQISDENKMNISKADLVRLLSMLKSELQSKELALAAIKCEQLKRLINPIEISRSSLANTYMELQDRLKGKDRNNNNNGSGNADVAIESSKNDNELESLNILNTLLELLDRHPLLALPRDSIYCLDYNCSELSTKNYLNLKIQHLDNLINQHRRYRYYMSERLRRCEQRLLEMSRELENERNSKVESENINYKTGGRVALLKHISQLKDTIEKEKQDKQAIVMTLLNELLDAKEQVETLTSELKQCKIAQNKAPGEIGKLKTDTGQTKNIEEISPEEELPNDLKNRVIELEKENKALKARLEQQEWRLAAILKPEKTPPVTKMNSTSTTIVSSQVRSSNNVKTAFTRTKQTSLNSGTLTSSSTPITSSRVSSNLAKITPPPKPRVPAKPAQLLDQQRNSK